MFSFFPSPLVGFLMGLCFLINIMVIATLIIFTGIIEALTPIKSLKEPLIKLQNDVLPAIWMDVNYIFIKLFTKTELVIDGQGDLNSKNWYFVFANHRSWADIVVLQRVFNRKIPMLKFFLKKELLWSIPIGGLACWMLDFPFMKRYSKAYLKKNPEMRNEDLKTTQKACAKFEQRPTTIMSFLEGTRFTPQKQQDRSSPYRHLLRPKAGGLALVISEMKNYIKEVVAVTIVYDNPQPSFWNFLCGRISKIRVNYTVIPLPPELYGDYYQDPQFRRYFQNWLNGIWKQKDNLIDTILSVKDKESDTPHTALKT
jgi:1-acyl-sn-glycerol-3-phosphate acyltransferase